jgi:hypothetical protein
VRNAGVVLCVYVRVLEISVMYIGLGDVCMYEVSVMYVCMYVYIYICNVCVCVCIYIHTYGLAGTSQGPTCVY